MNINYISTALVRCKRCRDFVPSYSDDGLCDFCHALVFDRGFRIGDPEG